MVEKNTNIHNSKCIQSDDLIKISLERKFDKQYELVRNKGENGKDKHHFGTLALAKQLPPKSMDWAPQNQLQLNASYHHLIKTH
jgi:hypothetical protein